MTNEDNDNSDTTYTNKNDTNNHNAHNLHKRAQQRAVSVCLHYVSHHIGSSRPWVCHLHLHVIHDVRFSLTSPSSLASSTCPSPSSSSLLSWCTLSTTQTSTTLDSVENNLRDSAKESNDANDVPISLTGYEPNDTVSNELFDSRGLFSYVTPSSDQDMDDTTLSKPFAEVYREYTDYRSLEVMSASPSSMSVMVDRTGKLVEISLELLRSEKVPVHILGLCFDNKDEGSSQNVARKFLITNTKQFEPKKNAEFYKKNYGVSKRIFVKFINKILLRRRNYENSRVLPSIRSPDWSSSRIRILLWNYMGDYKNCKMK